MDVIIESTVGVITDDDIAALAVDVVVVHVVHLDGGHRSDVNGRRVRLLRCLCRHGGPLFNFLIRFFLGVM
jgi:hypothetical protein